MNSRLVLSICIMYIGFLVHYYCDEALMDKDHPELSFPYKDSLQFWTYFATIGVSIVVLQISKQKIINNPLPFFSAGFFTFGSHTFAFYVKKHLDYATVNILKSGKPAAVMILALLRGSKISKDRIITVVGLTCGLLFFSITGKPVLNVPGVLLLLLDLFCDAMYVPQVDKLMEYTNSPFTVMLYTYFWLLIFTCCKNYNEIGKSIIFMSQAENFTKFGTRLILYSLTLAFSLTALYVSIGLSNGLLVSIASTTRKFLTVLISSISFRHSFSLTQWIGICIVFLSLCYEPVKKWVFSKIKKEKNN